MWDMRPNCQGRWSWSTACNRCRTGRKLRHRPLDRMFLALVHTARAAGPPLDNARRHTMLFPGPPGSQTFAFNFATGKWVSEEPPVDTLILPFTREELPPCRCATARGAEAWQTAGSTFLIDRPAVQTWRPRNKSNCGSTVYQWH
jgi:hypothetical protein